MMYDNAEAIQAKLAKKLGHRPVNRIWEFLVRENYVDDVEGGFADIDYLAEKYRENRASLAEEIPLKIAPFRRKMAGIRHQITNVSPREYARGGGPQSSANHRPIISNHR